MAAGSPILLYAVRTFVLGHTSHLADPLFLAKNALVGLGLTTDVLVLVAVGILGMLQIRDSDPTLANAALLFVAGFLALSGASIVAARATVLPRYWITIIPSATVCAFVYLHRRFSMIGPAVFGLTVLCFSLVNQTGWLYPEADHPHPVFAERSLGATRYLRLQIATTRALAEAPAEQRIVDSNMWIRLLYPELGYVDEPVTNLVLIKDAKEVEAARVAWAVEPHGRRADQALSAFFEQDRGTFLVRQPVYEGFWTSSLVVARPDSS